MVLQFLILHKLEDESTKDTDKSTTVNNTNIDIGVSETWTFMRTYWKLTVPKLIISVTDDTETSSMDRKLMKSIIYDLVKTAIAEGMLSFCKC